MPGSIRAIRRTLDPVRGRGRVPLSKRRTPGHPEFRTAGAPTLSDLEEQITDSIVDVVDSIPHETLLDAVVSGDVAEYGRVVLDTLAARSDAIEQALMDAFVASGDAAAIEIGNDLARAYRRVGKSVTKADAPLPSDVALRFRFDRTDPRAIDWVRRESGAMITNMVRSEQDAIRTIIDASFSAQQTVQQTGSGIFAQLRTVTPSAGAREFADALGSNLNGLTARYEQAVINRVQTLGDDLAARGVTGTKALDQMRKEGDRHAQRLRRARSKTIARTERMRAHNQARLLSFQQAVDSGIASAEYSRKQWKTGPFDVCPVCVAMQGAESKVNEAFTLPNGSQVEAPPAHPNCRCTMTMRTDTRLYDPPRNLGTGQPGDPFRTEPRMPSAQGRDLAQRPLPSTPAQPAVPTQQTTRPSTSISRFDEPTVSIDGEDIPTRYVKPDGSVDVNQMYLDKKRLRDESFATLVEQQTALSPEVARSRDVYQSAFGQHFSINNALRTGTSNSTAELHLANLDSMFTDIIPTDTVLYRGRSFADKREFTAFMRGLEEGATVSDAAFMSTTLDESTAVMFSGLGQTKPSVVLEIRARAGSTTYRAIEGSEYEVLLPRGTELRIVSITETPGGLRSKYNITRIVAEIVNKT